MERRTLHFICRADNDLYRVVQANGLPAKRYDRPAGALEAVGCGEAVLLLADVYPSEGTNLDKDFLAGCLERNWRLYVEFPRALPECELGEPAVLTLGIEAAELAWRPSVRPSYSARDDLPEDAEARAFRRGVDWFFRARLFIHPTWRDEAERRRRTFPDGTGRAPEADWPVGDGSCGMIEGASSRIHPDGSQDWRYHRRSDCMGEVAMALALSVSLASGRRSRHAVVAANLIDYVLGSLRRPGYDHPDDPCHGLLPWTVDESERVYYGDDNARSLLGMAAAASLLGESR